MTWAPRTSRAVPAGFLLAHGVLGLAAGAVTGSLGTLAHLGVVVAGGDVWPAGLALAVGLVLSADTALAAVTRSAVAMLASATGRALAVATAAAPGPGGDLLIQGGWPSEVWALGAVLVPALAAPLLSTWAAARRAQEARRGRAAPLGSLLEPTGSRPSAR